MEPTDPKHWHLWRRSEDGRAYFVQKGGYPARSSAQRRATTEAIGTKVMVLVCDGRCPEDPTDRVKRD